MVSFLVANSHDAGPLDPIDLPGRLEGMACWNALGFVPAQAAHFIMVLKPETLSGTPFSWSSMVNHAAKIRGCIRSGNVADAVRFDPS
jgi:hypothetical protein